MQRWVKLSGSELGQTIRFRGVSNHQVKTLVKLTGVELSLLINDPVWPSRLIENTATWRVREKTDTCNGGLSDDEKQQIDSRVVKC